MNNYPSHLFSLVVLRELVLVLCEHELSVLQDICHVLLLAQLDHAIALQLGHLISDALHLALNLVFLALIIDTFEEALGSIQVIPVEVVSEDRVGIREIFSSGLEGYVLF